MHALPVQGLPLFVTAIILHCCRVLMASESVDSMHKKFSFMLEYMGRAMLLKTCRAKSYRVVNLCNIASLVLNTPESPSIHYFCPRVILPWAGREFDVFTEEAFSKLLNVCMVKGHFNLHMVVLFDAFELTDGSLQRVEVPRMHLGNGEQPVVISDETFGLGMVNDVAKSSTMLRKRRYKCTKCSGIGHNKRACKLFKPSATVCDPSANAKATNFFSSLYLNIGIKLVNSACLCYVSMLFHFLRTITPSDKVLLCFVNNLGDSN